MADNIRRTPLGGLLRRGATGDVPTEMSAVDQLRRYQESIAAPPKPLISPAASYIQQVARERVASPEQAPVVGFGDRAMSASQDEILRQAELKAIADIATPRLLDETSPARVTNFALRTGNEAGDNNRERSFLERMAQSGLLSTLQGMARAERQYGVGPLAAFSESALDVQAARSAAEQEAAEAQAKVDIERLKNQPKPPKPSTEITNLYKEMGVYQSGLNTFDRIKGILSQSIATGGAGSVLAGLNNIAAAFNINLPTDAQTSVNKAVAEIRTQLIASRAYGREANKDEQKLIRALIPEAGTFQTIKELEEAYKVAAASMKRKANETNAVMTGVYGLPSYGTVVPTSPLFTRPNQGK